MEHTDHTASHSEATREPNTSAVPTADEISGLQIGNKTDVHKVFHPEIRTEIDGFTVAKHMAHDSGIDFCRKGFADALGLSAGGGGYIGHYGMYAYKNGVRVARWSPKYGDAVAGWYALDGSGNLLFEDAYFDELLDAVRAKKNEELERNRAYLDRRRMEEEVDMGRMIGDHKGPWYVLNMRKGSNIEELYYFATREAAQEALDKQGHIENPFNDHYLDFDISERCLDHDDIDRLHIEYDSEGYFLALVEPMYDDE